MSTTHRATPTAKNYTPQTVNSEAMINPGLGNDELHF